MDPPLYDVFISYAHVDADWGRWIHQGLTRRGLRVFLDEAVLRLGDRFHLEIEKSLQHSITVALVVSRSSQNSAWVDFETTYHWSEIFVEGRRRLIPLLIEAGVAVPQRLRNFHSYALKDRTDGVLDDLTAKILDYPEFQIGPYEFREAAELGRLAGTIAECVARYAPADEARRALVERVIDELVGNGFRHGGPTPRVTLTVEVTQKFARVVVGDSGAGFDLRKTMVDVRRRLKADPAAGGALGLLMLQHAGVELANAPPADGLHQLTAVGRWARGPVTPPGEDLAIEIDLRGDTVVFASAGRIDHKTAEQFGARLEPFLDACARDLYALILDLTQVNYISSVGLRTLMLAARAARAQGGTILLCGLSPVVSEIFHVSKFDQVFTIHETVEAAFASLGTE